MPAWLHYLAACPAQTRMIEVPIIIFRDNQSANFIVQRNFIFFMLEKKRFLDIFKPSLKVEFIYMFFGLKLSWNIFSAIITIT
jgi:hypothetical protein